MPKRLQLPDEIKKRVQIKNVKDNIGHDLMGMYCDITLNKKNVGYYNDDGWGGGPDISLEQKGRNELLQLLERHQWRHRMFTELGWNFYESENKIDDDTVIENMIEHLYEEKQKEKMMKKIAKQSEKEILYGRWDNYIRSSFKGGMTLSQMVRSYGQAKVQDYIDRNIKTKLKEGEEILNTNFEELGLTK